MCSGIESNLLFFLHVTLSCYAVGISHFHIFIFVKLLKCFQWNDSISFNRHIDQETCFILKEFNYRLVVFIFLWVIIWKSYKDPHIFASVIGFRRLWNIKFFFAELQCRNCLKLSRLILYSFILLLLNQLFQFYHYIFIKDLYHFKVCLSD